MENKEIKHISLADEDLDEVNGGESMDQLGGIRPGWKCGICGAPYWGNGFVLENDTTLQYVSLGKRCEPHCREPLEDWLRDGWRFVRWIGR